ncbi:hypothetical protein JDV02_008040 [Purpureocillium takamizusanense]|uniref:Aminoglycoside phosphotransferase domain-containing protein n=1 Tax=Purpureocillium takamizusanense TaxID=2060973 RepID=A0A9Q8QLW8_9HYPO|nr:uncharacterized protein JDV02_008040 [Purpureocillium takamizusanense]UNI22120.1 hypothetical protein JDV02_008040 [Purpureocillium takamizusanense]
MSPESTDIPDSDSDDEVFGPLVAISEESLVLLALNISNRVLHAPSSSGKLVSRIRGSYNIVHIIQLDGVRLVIRVPATGWGSGMTITAARALQSQVATIRLIRRSTTIPVPEVYGLDTTSNNEIGAPYLCMSFMPGKTVSKTWFDGFSTIPREELRLRILTSLSQTMAQFSRLAFAKMGSVMEDEAGSTFIGPSYDWYEDDDGSLQVKASGPFDSASAYLKHHVVLSSKGGVWDEAEAKVMHSVLPCLVSRNGFVLCPPDFDSQNVMVDEQGNVTGLIDWDLTQTMPRFLGYARYPSWITRDWDPLMYGWPKMVNSEDSPEALERYRAYYKKELGRALCWQGDWEFTEKSHVAEAVWIAGLNRHNRPAICRKLVQVAAGEDVDALDILYDIGSGHYSEEDWIILESKLRQLIR